MAMAPGDDVHALVEERDRLEREVAVALNDAAHAMQRLSQTVKTFVQRGGVLDAHLKTWSQLFDDSRAAFAPPS